MWGAIHPDVRQTAPDANYLSPVSTRVPVAPAHGTSIHTQTGGESFRDSRSMGEKAAETEYIARQDAFRRVWRCRVPC